jgi:putative addiction module component (TIGR02574 family)
MSSTADSVYKEAVQLNPIDRAELIEKLFASFSSSQKPEIEQKWKDEVQSRVKAYDNDEIPSDSMENVFKKLSQR